MFVHIHRDPYAVFQSFVHTYERGLPFGRLQRTDIVDWTERIIRQYKELYAAFFEERDLIPAGRFYDLGYEALEQDPVGDVRKIYEALGLPEFGSFKPKVRAYVDSLSGYRKNEFTELAPEVRHRIAGEWGRCFEEWGYPV